MTNAFLERFSVLTMFLHMYDLSLKGFTELQERKTSRQTPGTQRILGLGQNKFEDGTTLFKTP